MLEINYDKCLTNLSNSILKYYNVKTFHNSLEIVDKELLTNKSKNVIFFQFYQLQQQLQQHL